MAVEEQFILRVPLDIAEQLNQLLSKQTASADLPIDLAFSEDGRTGNFTVGGRTLPASLLDLPGVVESWKTYDDNHLVKSADIGQIILVSEEGAEKPEGPEYRHGLTPPMREARRQRFRSEPDYDPEQVARVEKELERILQGGPARDMEVEEVLEDDEEEGHEGDRKERKKKKKKKKRKDKDKDKERTNAKDKDTDKDMDKDTERTKDKGRSKDKDSKKKERSNRKKDKSKDKQSKKRKKRETEASGEGLEESEGALKRVRVELHSNGLTQDAAANGSADNAGQALEGLDSALERNPDAAAGSDFGALADVLYEEGGEEAPPEAGQEVDETDADFERDLLDSLEEANGFPEGAERDPPQEENELDEGGAEDEGNGLGEGGGPGETGGMFSFTGEVAGLDGADLNDNAFDFGTEEGNLEAEEDERGDIVTMPWDV